MSDEERIEQLELENKVLQKNNKGLKAKIDEQQKEIEKLKEKIKNFTIEDEKIFIQFGEIIEKKKWENKIKAKIEEYERLSNNITIQPQIYPYIIEVLQSLLEKE